MAIRSLAPLFILLWLPMMLLLHTSAVAAPKLTGISAVSAVLLDAATGEVLWEKNAHQRRAPASTTKIITALVALERGNLNSIVLVTPRAAGTPGSRLELSGGQQILLEDLLTGLMLRSGNDAAVAIAEHIAGSEAAFAELMNAKARELGAFNSNFCNPHGLDKPNHYTTAYDLAWLTRHALLIPKFTELVQLKETTIDWKKRERPLRNTNRLLWSLLGADGVKTGTTGQAGQCLVSSATRNNQQLIAVVLHSANRWRDSVKLLEYGFHNFELVTFGSQKQVIDNIQIKNGMEDTIAVLPLQDMTMVVETGFKPNLTTKVDMPAYVVAPVFKGQKIGELVVYHNEKAIKSFDLIASQSVTERTWSRLFLHQLLGTFRVMSTWGVL